MSGKQTETTSYEEVSRLVIEAIEQEQFFNKATLVPKVKALLRGFHLNLHTTNYNKLITPTREAKRLRAMEQRDAELKWWKTEMKGMVGEDKMQAYFDRVNKYLEEQGFREPIN